MSLMLPNRSLSKSEMDTFISYFYTNSIKLKAVFDNLKTHDRFIVYNTLWLLRELAPKNIFHLNQYFPSIAYDLIKKYENDEGILRNLFSVLQYLEIKEPFDGYFLQYCFQYLSEHHWPVAIKAYSMSVSFNISIHYQELLQDLKLLVEENIKLLGPESPAIISRGNKILKNINQHLRK